MASRPSPSRQSRWPKAAKSATAQADTNGNYTRVLLPGTYDLAASAPTGLSSNQLITVTPAADIKAAPLVFGPSAANIPITDAG